MPVITVDLILESSCANRTHTNYPKMGKKIMTIEEIIETISKEEINESVEQVKAMEKEEIQLLGPMNMMAF
ncbi:MAG: hypothetical protein ACI9CO_000011 [Candidatus Azotimanducaceae bacterium]|jgi:hypothetical protein